MLPYLSAFLFHQRISALARRSSNVTVMRRVLFSLQSTWGFALSTSKIWAWLLAWTHSLRQSLEYLPMLGRLMLGPLLLQLDPRSSRMTSAGVYLSLTDVQEPERTSAYFALLQGVLNNLSLTIGLQRLYLLTSAHRTSWVRSSSVSYLQWRPFGIKVSLAILFLTCGMLFTGHIMQQLTVLFS